MMKNPIHIALAGGGTLGHLFPGLAVAARLVEDLPQARITLVGSGKPLERQQVAAAGFEYFAQPCCPLPRRPMEAVRFLVENVAGYLAADRFLSEQRVSAVVGLGGYASVPMGRAAHRRMPLILLEQNVVLGRANRWLSRHARLICASFDPSDAWQHLPCPVRVTGNPIRQPAVPQADLSERRQLLVLGGSGGARSLNENVPRALYKVRDQLAQWQIVHQTGEADVQPTRELYRKLALEATVEPFLADLPGVMAQSGLAVCRAGGTTLAELAAAGVPSLLVPYPHAVGDHQRKNAEALSRVGGAVLVDERDISGRLDDGLAQTLCDLLGDADRRAAMSASMRTFARPDAAGDVASLIWSLVASQASKGRVAVAA